MEEEHLADAWGNDGTLEYLLWGIDLGCDQGLTR